MQSIYKRGVQNAVGKCGQAQISGDSDLRLGKLLEQRATPEDVKSVVRGSRAVPPTSGALGRSRCRTETGQHAPTRTPATGPTSRGGRAGVTTQATVDGVAMVSRW